MSNFGEKKSYSAPKLTRLGNADEVRGFAERAKSSPEQQVRLEEIIKAMETKSGPEM